jgi:TldD protein
MFDEKRVLKALMEGGGIYGDIFTEERKYTHIQLESGRIEKLERAEDRGVGIRVINPWKTFYASTNSFDEAHLIETALHGKIFKRGPCLNTRTEKRVVADYPFSVQLSDEVVSKKNLLLVKGLEAMVRKMKDGSTSP